MLLAAALACVGASARASSSPALAASRQREEAPSSVADEAEGLAGRWAPTFLQHVSTRHPERDRPARVDFDGDWDATNNWARLETSRPGAAVVYASSILTETHAYLTYTLFYPRDWIPVVCVPRVCHDNDLEVALVVVERPTAGNGGDGRLVFVETKAHNSYAALPAAEVALDGPGRPLIQIESQGHGMSIVERGDGADVEDVTQFSHARAGAWRVDGVHDAENYELISLRDTLWARRSPTTANGHLWAEGETGYLGFHGQRYGRLGAALGVWMAGEEYSGGVRPPWGLLASAGHRGDWFLDPAMVAKQTYGAWLGADASQAYVLNPYLADLSSECSHSRCPAPPPPPEQTPWQPVGGVLALLGLVSLRSPRRGLVKFAKAWRRFVAR